MAPTVSQHDARFMTQAILLARRGLGRVEPNPMAGCLLVRGGRTIGQGYHRRFGGPHAEVEALQDCRRRGLDPAGSTAYITLEPCCHYGKTPPCTQALLRAKVAAVHVAIVDPFPEVAGKGIAELRQAGVQVHVGMGEQMARRLNEPFFKRIETGLPWVIAKWAQTLDGRIAAAAGDSQWISNPRSRKRVHKLRGRVDAIIVGIGTVLADDPLLTARDVRTRRVARRVVVDPNLRIPISSQLLATLEDPSTPPVTLAVHDRVHRARAPKLVDLEARGVEFIPLPRDPHDSNRAQLRPLFEQLVTRHRATNVMVEGGARLMGHLFRERLIDQVRVFVAPRLLGQNNALPAVVNLPGEAMTHALQLELRSTKRIGSDVVMDYRIAAPHRLAAATPQRG